MRNWKIISTLAAVVALAVTATAQADPVVPAAMRVVNLRDNSTTGNPYNSTTYYQNDFISMSNSVMYTGATTSSVVQNLDGCVIDVAISKATGVTHTNAYIISTNAGTWGVAFLCPTQDTFYVEVTVSNVFNFTYPRYMFKSQAHLK